MLSEIIKEALKEGAMTPKELRERTKQKASEIQKSFSDQNYHYHLNKLVKLGEIKKHSTIYEIVVETELDLLDIQECINTISRDQREEVLYSKFRQLRILSEKKRMTRHPKIIPILKESLEKPNIIENPKIFEELTLTFRNILRYERKHKSIGYKQTIKEINTEVLKKVINIIKRKNKFPDKNTICFLGQTRKREAVETIFDLIHKFKHEVIHAEKNETLANALWCSYSKLLLLISEKINDLVGSDDEELRIIGNRIHEIISWKRINN